ncbi:zinc-binding alcohol dehydrogenase family protein [Curtobacterium aurantiacum]|uniref:zinc-binding alcohol dehydrogenase family protein n=1 Tax=Curtobacterium aurantiacum TaxID=3236919 RepID=UPI001BDEF1E1|nr:zinc-binding alcohol dehydrogenase family protein [Curtobacterium flaccumfaciens]MBT1679748.1 zinc-binding alcohol dehydrogenase family protein [Curtobacterium flaccumfaciens pv. flaccumfaciens]
MTATMRAVVIDAPGGPDVLHLRELPIPIPGPGQVLIRVEAFGLNRSELHFRRGMGHFGTFPRVPGIEAVGTVEAAPGGEHAVGTQVAALMGGMGRDFDGGYAEYTLVPASSVVPFTSALDWAAIGAVPEMLQTAHGSLTVGVDARRGDTILVRGGTSSVGLACIVLAKQQGMTVIATTRNPDRAERLHATGADHVVVDTGRIADTVRRIVPDGVNGAVELIGTGTLPDTLRATAVHGTVSFSGMLSDVWTIPDFYPMAVIPNGVRLTAYSGEASDLPASVLQAFLDAVAAGTMQVPIAKVYSLEEIVQAHRDMEDGTRSGKLVVTIR